VRGAARGRARRALAQAGGGDGPPRRGAPRARGARLTLTVLQQKLAEAHGLALAATAVARTVEERVEDPELGRLLHGLQRDAEETRARCLLVEQGFGEELATELLQHANSTHHRGADLVGAWFKAGTDPITAWTFLAMGEAGEVAAWSAVASLAERSGEGAAVELAAWALPVQERHLEAVLAAAVRLADAFEPSAPRWG
jgi:hypothetical protein